MLIKSIRYDLILYKPNISILSTGVESDGVIPNTSFKYHSKVKELEKDLELMHQCLLSLLYIPSITNSDNSDDRLNSMNTNTQTKIFHDNDVEIHNNAVSNTLKKWMKETLSEEFFCLRDEIEEKNQSLKLLWSYLIQLVSTTSLAEVLCSEDLPNLSTISKVNKGMKVNIDNKKNEGKISTKLNAKGKYNAMYCITSALLQLRAMYQEKIAVLQDVYQTREHSLVSELEAWRQESQSRKTELSVFNKKLTILFDRISSNNTEVTAEIQDLGKDIGRQLKLLVVAREDAIENKVLSMKKQELEKQVNALIGELKHSQSGFKDEMIVIQQIAEV